MSTDGPAAYFKAQLNPDTGRLEISVLSGDDLGKSNKETEGILRINVVDENPLADIVVTSEKVDPKSTEGARLRPMWEKTTCDIIK